MPDISPSTLVPSDRTTGTTDMPPPLLLAKFVLLIVAMISEFVTYLSPTPSPGKEDVQRYNGGDFMARSATAISYLSAVSAPPRVL
ncbi:hypothetical protein NUW54_g3027 [Trametes sanguinea]|uniref:Uncharacterized protein n=1 Tax=Trametes sanguinea TaxID=158606 RepID=A0ACC1Q533_9APHY|nr:hypothetical protein NUW54_g3027 [Trametes sanguinea]